MRKLLSTAVLGLALITPGVTAASPDCVAPIIGHCDEIYQGELMACEFLTEPGLEMDECKLQAKGRFSICQGDIQCLG